MRDLDAKLVVESMEKQGKTQQEIDKALREMAFEVPQGQLQEPDYAVSPYDSAPTANYSSGGFVLEQTQEDPSEFGLDDEEVLHLQLR